MLGQIDSTSGLLTYQAAADIAGCSGPVLVKAVKAGTLQVHDRDGRTGFDRDEVLIWSYTRTFKTASKDVGTGIFQIQNFWTSKVPHMTVAMMRSPEKDHVNILKDIVYNYVAAVLNLPDALRYSYSECHAMRIMQDLALFNSEVVPRDQKNIEVRFLYSMYFLVKSNLLLLKLEFERLGLIDRMVLRDVICIDSFSSFRRELDAYRGETTTKGQRGD